MTSYGLIGKTLSHSFSKKYFTEKFLSEGLTDHRYDLFELESIEEVRELAKKPDLLGFNVTIPYKESIIPYLSKVEEKARNIGAVNVVKLVSGKMEGYNSDYYGFKESLVSWLPESRNNLKAIILGTGGASKAVSTALDDLQIPYIRVSRKRGEKDILKYDQVSRSVLNEYKIIINTTPVGMSPRVEFKPQLPYECITGAHFLYDLVYNPLETEFLKQGKSRGAQIKNGLEMLHLQAEKSWLIWHGHSTM